jgi:hypothetical protein
MFQKHPIKLNKSLELIIGKQESTQNRAIQALINAHFRKNQMFKKEKNLVFIHA